MEDLKQRQFNLSSHQFGRKKRTIDYVVFRSDRKETVFTVSAARQSVNLSDSAIKTSRSKN